VQHASRVDSVNLDGRRISRAKVRMLSERCAVAAVFANSIDLCGPDRHTAKHLTPFLHPRARGIRLRKTFKNLDTDLFRERTFDLAHAIPEPDDLALLLDIHGSPPKMTHENITGTILQAI
jgi:hypothetical protein